MTTAGSRGPVAIAAHGSLSKVNDNVDGGPSIPGTTPIKVNGRPKERMRSGALGSGTPPSGRDGSASCFSQINPRGRKIVFEASLVDRSRLGRPVPTESTRVRARLDDARLLVPPGSVH